MSCGRFDEETLSAWVDGETDAHETANVEGHLGDCVACRRTSDRWRALGRRVRKALDPADVAFVTAAMDAAIQRQSRRGLRPAILGIVAVAAATLVMVYGTFALPSRTTVEGGSDGATQALGAGSTAELAPRARIVLARGFGFDRELVVIERGRIQIRVADADDALTIELPDLGELELEAGSTATITRDETTGAVTIEIEAGRGTLRIPGEPEQTLEPGDRFERGEPAGDAGGAGADPTDETGAARPDDDDDAPPTEVVEVPPAADLRLLLGVREAGDAIDADDPDATLGLPLAALAQLQLGIRDEDLADAVSSLIGLKDTERRGDRLGVLRVLGDLAAAEELPAATRAELVELLVEVSARGDLLEQRLGARGLGAALGSGALSPADQRRVLERLDALALSAGGSTLRTDCLIALARWGGAAGRPTLEAAANDPDETVAATARALLDGN